MLLIALTALIAGTLVALVALYPRLQQALRRSSRPDFNAIACASTNDGIVVQTLDGKIIWANPAYLRIFRLPASRVIGQNPLSFCLPSEEQQSPAQIDAFRYDRADPIWGKLYIVRNRRSDGTLFWNQISASMHEIEGQQDLVILVCRDVTEQVEQERALRESTQSLAYMAEHDSLTGLANRNKYNAFINSAIGGDPETRAGLGVLQIDLDHFKAINDRHGHAAGDAALQHVAATLGRSLRQTDLLARLGGDEFVAVCPGISLDSELLRIGQALGQAVKAPLIYDGKQIDVSISIGAAIAGKDDNSADSLLQKSDFALYEVKRAGRGSVAVYDSTLHEEAQRRDRFSLQLRDAIECNKLTFYFQPTVDLHTGAIRGFEALVRWQHPTRGLLHPSEFLTLAAELNLLRHIDIAAVGAAADLRKRLQQNDFNDIKVGINGSRHLLSDEEHADRLPAELARVGVQTRNIVLEFNERDIFGNAAMIDANMRSATRLVDMGFNVLIDGFGSGYAGLMHIERLKVAGIKIEKALIRHLDCTPACEKITSMLLQFGQEKGIYCVACGIETADQADKTRSYGGSVGQGNFFARAMPSGDVIDWLRQRQANARLRDTG
ncbi:putative bifunctional diguanylate cyclase/phosphodiesterase [Loktanella sp. R86503]|uniref:putative bifunctional diguanylate cyclase/phosphodiesterase n=1 Tax=Loktanella sp. R86503 TaxID=3093847 RepID=UPI0036DC719A